MKVILFTHDRPDELEEYRLQLSFPLVVESPEGNLLVLVELSHKLIPAIDIYSIISVCLEDLHHILESHHHCDVVILAIGQEPLQRRLRVIGAHEKQVACLG